LQGGELVLEAGSLGAQLGAAGVDVPDELLVGLVDFETTTPKGHRPEPIEVAVLSLATQQGHLAETGRFTGLMKPPPQSPGSTPPRRASRRRWSTASRPPPMC
jgi:hypothetical protein